MYEFHATFATLDEMLEFANKIGKNTAGTNLTTILQRIDKMANTEVAGVISSMQAGFAQLNEAQARSGAALDRVLGLLADMPARIQSAVDAANAAGVDPAQIAALTALQAQVATEVAEAQAEATRLETAAPAVLDVPPPAPVNPNPNPGA